MEDTKMISQSIEYLEKAKDELYSVKIQAEEKEDYDLRDTMEIYIELIQETIDSLTDEFISEEEEI